MAGVDQYPTRQHRRLQFADVADNLPIIQCVVLVTELPPWVAVRWKTHSDGQSFPKSQEAHYVDAMDRSGLFCAGRSTLADIVQRHYTHQSLVAIDDRQTPHLKLIHIALYVANIFVIKTVFRFVTQDFAHAHLGRVLSGGHDPDHQIAVGDNADELVSLGYREKAYIVAGKIAGGGNDSLITMDYVWIAIHDFIDLNLRFHFCLLYYLDYLGLCRNGRAIRLAEAISVGSCYAGQSRPSRGMTNTGL